MFYEFWRAEKIFYPDLKAEQNCKTIVDRDGYSKPCKGALSSFFAVGRKIVVKAHRACKADFKWTKAT